MIDTQECIEWSQFDLNKPSHVENYEIEGERL